MKLHLMGSLRALLFVTGVVAIPSLAVAQASPAGTAPPTPSSFDIYGSYAYLRPFSSDLYGQNYDPIPAGAIGGVTAYFKPSWGLDLEYAKLFNSPDYCFSTIQGGLRYRRSMGRLVPFVHAIAGPAQIGPSYQHSGSSNQCTWGWGANGGVGLDYILPAFHNRLALRIPEADFQYARANFGQRIPPASLTGGEGEIYSMRLSAGFVIRLGESAPPLAASYACEVSPVSVYPGDPVTVTGKTLNLEENKHLLPTYTWTTTGGKIGPQTSSPNNTVATAGLAPGDYTVGGVVSEGAAPNRHASCTASFRVMAYEPPTVACSANPASIAPGGYATISAEGRSPQNRPLTYSFRASAGQVTANGTHATLATADVPPGNVTVTCNAVDDQGHQASANTTVSIVAPPPPPAPPAPQAQKLCSISFERDKKRPVRVDNEAKGCLDDIAIALGRDPTSLLVVVGKHGSDEKPDAAAERTLNVKQYLVTEKGIDASRIEVRTGETKDRTADTVLVPQGASWDTEGTESFDPARIQRHGEAYSPELKQKK
jgi:outer membrane protein OmpA-like peptidoglycan-associated protein